MLRLSHCIILAITLASGAVPATQAKTPSLSVTFEPHVVDGAMHSLIVEERIDGVSAGPSAPLLQLAHVTFNVPTVATALKYLEAEDARGPLALEARDAGEGAAMVRQWFPARTLAAPVKVRYEVVPPAVMAPRGAAPPIELRVEGGALSGGGATLLLRPIAQRVDLTFAWRLPRDVRGNLAVDSLAGKPERAFETSQLDQVYLMVGALGRYPDARNAQGFQAVWQGTPPFDAAALMAWTERLHAYMVGLFHPKVAPYTVFLRRNPVNAGGGFGMLRSFIATFADAGSTGDAGKNPEALKLTLSHEMFHTFQPSLTLGEGPEALAASWFNEGLAVFYQRVLPLRAGLIDAQAFLADVNITAGRYYTSAFANLPNSEIPGRFWQDTRVRTLPYDRGSLYFATVDDGIRRKSHGQRSLDDLMLALRARQDAGEPVTVAAWESAVRNEIGEEGVSAFRGMLAGEVPLPESDAFGPCFRRVSRELRRYQLGFDPKVLTESPRIVHGLIAGSNAAAAGLRDGDEILKPVAQDELQGRQEGVLRLAVRRGDHEFEVSYQPRGERVPAWQWERIPDVPESACVLHGASRDR